MEIPTRLTPKEGRKFGLTLGIAFLLLAGLFYWRNVQIVAAVLAGVGSVLIILGLVVPTRLEPIRSRWMAFGILLSRFVSPVMLAIVYFGVVTPFGVAMRFFSKNPLLPDQNSSTAWVTRDADKRRDLNRQF